MYIMKQRWFIKCDNDSENFLYYNRSELSARHSERHNVDWLWPLNKHMG